MNAYAGDLTSGLVAAATPAPERPVEPGRHAARDRSFDVEVRRGELDTEVAVRIDAHSSSFLFFGLEGYIERGGVFVATYHVIAPGSAVALEITGDAGTVALSGTVRFVADGGGDGARGIGVAFTPIEPRHRAALAALARQRPPIYLDAFDDASEPSAPALERCA